MSNLTHGKFISVEGSEGAGKSTAMQCISDYFTSKHIEMVKTREPGGTPLAEAIRKMLLHFDEEKVLPITELLLMFACRAQHIGNVIMPALRSGKWVVTDRYIDASYAYQGGGREINFHDIELLDSIIVDDLYPDLTILLDLPAELGLKRAEHRGEKDRIEREHLEFFIRIRNAYLERAKEDPERIKIIDASQPLEMVKSNIYQLLDEFFASQLQ